MDWFLTLEKFEGYWVQDCSAATQNMLLEVTDKGLGAVWLGVYPMQDRVEYIKKRSVAKVAQLIIVDNVGVITDCCFQEQGREVWGLINFKTGETR